MINRFINYPDVSLPFKRVISIYSTHITKEYFQITNYYANRIIKAALFLSYKNLGPKIYEINRTDDFLIIKMEKLIEITEDINPDRIFDMVHTLHNNDWCHGDLHGKNIMINENKELRIIDFDTMFRISKGKTDKKVLKYILSVNYNNYKKFVSEDDFTNWQY